MKMKGIFITLSALLFLFSCKRDEEKPNDIYLLHGRYTLKTLTSDIPLDLDHDGVSSADILQELDLEYSNGSSSNYKYFDIKEGKASSEKYSFFGGWVLTADFKPQYNDYDIYYLPMNFSGKILKYDRNTNALEYETEPPFEHIPLFPEDIDTRTGVTITKMEVLPDMKIKITMKHRFTEYPETYPDCWENVVLTAVYEKM
jgi:hypothetical protein